MSQSLIKLVKKFITVNVKFINYKPKVNSLSAMFRRLTADNHAFIGDILNLELVRRARLSVPSLTKCVGSGTNIVLHPSETELRASKIVLLEELLHSIRRSKC